jgi:hypothetical protein
MLANAATGRKRLTRRDRDTALTVKPTLTVAPQTGFERERSMLERLG